MDARSRLVGYGCMLLVFVTLQVPVSGRAVAQTRGGSLSPSATEPSEENQPSPAATPAAGTRPALEDRRGWSADKKAEEATKRAADLKAQANRRKDEPCPVIADWKKWFQETLDVEASWVAMKEVRDRVRKSGASADKVRPFRDVFGSVDEWEALVNALRRNMIDCANRLNIRRADSSEERRMVTERERQRTAIELGELGFGPRVQSGCPSGDCPADSGTPHPAGSMGPEPSRASGAIARQAG